MLTEIVTLGGGCFWCIEALLKKLKGVQSVISGYADGTVDNPGYQQVCSGSTGHAEVVQVKYDSEIITFVDLLEVFFDIHNPTTLNRQGNDIGTQYRSIILYHTDRQKAQASKFIAELVNKEIWMDSVVTELKPLTVFYKAEEYHQDYYQNNPENSYCQFVIPPKLIKIKNKYNSLLK